MTICSGKRPGCGIAAAVLMLLAGGYDRLGAAQTVLVNGHIYTSDPARPWVEAVAIDGDKFGLVGDTKSILAAKAANATVIDLQGRMAMPGMIDTHTHFLWGSYGLAGIRLETAANVADVKKRLEVYAKAHPQEFWVYGEGWSYGSFWPTGLPTKELLDEIFPNRPVTIMSGDGHSLWVNSKALALAKIDKNTKDPVGDTRGIIVRDKRTGEPTGVLEEGAKRIVQRIMNVSRDEKMRRLKTGLSFANEHGITGVVNATGDIPEMEFYQQLAQRGELTVRMTTAFAEDVGVRHSLSPEELKIFEEARRRFTGDWVRAGIIKFFADGVIETHTAAMLEPYANGTGDRGKTLYTPEEFRKDFLELDRRGFQVMTHAIGDGAVRTVLDAYEYVAQKNGPRDRRWRLEHMETVAPTDFGRLARLHVLAGFQPWCCPQQDEAWEQSVGTNRMNEAIPWRSVVNPGATLILGSDWPVESLDPFAILQMGLTRKPVDVKVSAPFHPEESLTLEQMLAGYTRNAAYAEFMEKRLGSITPGKLADIIVLSQNIFETRADKIKDTKVVLTVVGGKTVWRGGI
jgi:predicted amidohydrolase YtcJ